MALYQYVKEGNNPHKLSVEILTCELSDKIGKVEVVGNDVSVETDSELDSSEEAALSTVISSHNSSAVVESVDHTIASAAEFGSNLIKQFARENVLAGITAAGKTRQLALYCHRLEHYMQTGSLYAAIEEINVMLADATLPASGLSPYLTYEKLEAYKAVIEEYLGIT